MVNFVENPPDARNLMLTARSFGNYDLASALADIIDNSIDAKAATVKITADFREGYPVIHIIDNGTGMTADELKSAMRPATKSPEDVRSPDELGRFGWGLKSASFSQCLKLTVISSKGGIISGALWDLDQIDNWKMGVLSEKEIEGYMSENLNSDGTLVVWENCDRLMQGGQLEEEDFTRMCSEAINRLRLVFHQYLEGKKRKKLSLFFNEREMEAFDPYHSTHKAHQFVELEPVKFENETLVAEGHILPHFSKLPMEDQEVLGGPEGMMKNQGFYVYRNGRLIINGTWFNIRKYGEFSQLVRISLDIPNTLDTIWKITIDKSGAELPAKMKRQLQNLVEATSQRSRSVHRKKGGRIGLPNEISLWERFNAHGEVKYRINRNHPLIETLLAGEVSPKSVLSIIEQSIPIDALRKDLKSGNSRTVIQPTTDPEQFRKEFEDILPSLLNRYETREDLKRSLKNELEPYKSHWNLVEQILKQMKMGF